MIDFKKLLHEWKTFSLAVATFLVGLHDAVVLAGYGPSDFAPIIPKGWEPYTPLALGLAFLALRKYTDNVSNK